MRSVHASATAAGSGSPADTHVRRERTRSRSASRSIARYIVGAVESALLQHDAVAECAVVGSPDEARGHVVKAFVVASDGFDAGAPLAAELQQHVKDQIAPYKYPRRIEFVDALPRTLTGKVQRALLRKREEGAAAV